MRVSLEPRKIENHQKKSVIVRAWSGNDSSQISNRGLIKEAEVHFQVYRTRGKVLVSRSTWSAWWFLSEYHVPVSQRSPPEHSPSTATDPSSATGGNPGAEHGRKPSVQQSAQDVVVPGRATNKWRRLSSIISRAAAIHAPVEAQQFPGDLLRISIPRVGVSALSPRDDGGDEKASPLSSPPLAW
ncbi:hypothetical protein EDB92DRAFT_1815451 [Lactarius akahatsu]|uniref:Uncharacterized protein n=1 Tax=Lactarius akahatsu TaxID=416441 RepID=A0AAD4QEN2_9AGAM|nr:hypothetical protein EDB92DRAFT_1815451 [Lactarius akahatsu]